ncbi:MAG: DUF3990 domain-containing protein [Lachnospiraceae bacterium]|nr:DUF3990 domain-containing protein [Lachnospiraceae bacterium]
MGKLTLYHGSGKIINKPVYGVGNVYNDYGQGFYCTQVLELAKEWACTEEMDGYANKYVLNTDGLSILDMSNGDYNILNWLAILLENRTFKIGGDIAIAAKEYLQKNFRVVYEKYDIIKGYRADDSYFSFATAFINNSLSLASLEKAMYLGELGEQIVLKSRRAFEQIEFEGHMPAKKEIYYPKKLARDTKAREAYKQEKTSIDIVNDVFIMDIIREGWKNDDNRIQRILFK